MRGRLGCATVRGYQLTVNLNMADSQRAAREFVRRALIKTGWSSTRLAKEAGLAASTLNRFLNSSDVKHTLSGKTISKIAAVADLPDPFAAVEAATTYTMPRIPVPDRETEEDLPVLGAAVGGEEGVFVFNGQILAKVGRPAKLRNVPDAYAVYMRGSSMEPKYTDGQLLYVDPHKPVRAGDYVVVEFTDHRAFVKQFVRRDGRQLVLLQFSPEREELFFDLATVRHYHKIVHTDEL